MRLPIMLAAGCVSLAATLFAQAVPDPPGRVARLSYLNGSVGFRPGDAQEWTAAELNAPLTTNDHLWTDEESFADVYVGASAFHLAPRTALGVLLLDDRVAQFSVSEGAVNIRIPRLDEDEIYEIDTPNGAVSLLRAGDYRIDVDPEGKFTLVTVRAGEAEMAAGGQKFPVRAGQMLRLFGVEQVTAEFAAAPALDRWDEWCLSRDREAERAFQISQTYVSWEMAGAEDLGRYGDWETDVEYGPCWRPRSLAADWAPYRYGHWTYRAPWGWTWIDDAQWGFAPFHYGRWMHVRSGWVWIPGPLMLRPVYSPALVAFLTGPGPGFIGWIPLGPREQYRPHFRASERYVRSVNQSIGNPRTNGQHVNRGWETATTQTTFASARPIGAGRARLGERESASLRVVDTPNVQPTRESYSGRGAQTGARPVRPPSRAVERTVIVRHELPESVRPPVPVQGVDARPRRTRPVENVAPPTNATAPAREDPRVQSEEQRRAEQRREAVEQRRQSIQRRAEEDNDNNRREQERIRSEEVRRQADEGRRLDQQRQDVTRRQQELQRQAEEARQQEQRRLEEGRHLQEQRRAEESRRADEQRRADEGRRMQEQRRVEEQRRADEGRRMEEQRRHEESRRQDEQRRADEGRRMEEQRRHEESRRQDEQRRADEGRRMEEQRRHEETRRQDEQRRADEGRRMDEQRRHEEQRRADENRKQEESRKQEEARKKQ